MNTPEGFSDLKIRQPLRIRSISRLCPIFVSHAEPFVKIPRPHGRIKTKADLRIGFLDYRDVVRVPRTGRGLSNQYLDVLAVHCVQCNPVNVTAPSPVSAIRT